MYVTNLYNSLCSCKQKIFIFVHFFSTCLWNTYLNMLIVSGRQCYKYLQTFILTLEGISYEESDLIPLQNHKEASSRLNWQEVHVPLFFCPFLLNSTKSIVLIHVFYHVYSYVINDIVPCFQAPYITFKHSVTLRNSDIRS